MYRTVYDKFEMLKSKEDWVAPLSQQYSLDTIKKSIHVEDCVNLVTCESTQDIDTEVRYNAYPFFSTVICFLASNYLYYLSAADIKEGL